MSGHLGMMKEDTAEVVETVESKLPDGATIGAKGLTAVLHATLVDLENDWARAGVEKAFLELKTGENQNPYAPDGCEPPVDGDPEIAQYDENSADWEAAINAVRNSWKIYPDIESGDFPIEFHAAVSKDRTVDTSEVLEKFGVATTGRSIQPGFQKRCFVLVLVELYARIDESNLTEREFSSFHLSVRYRPKQVAQTLSEIFDSEQSTGSVRKYNSRARTKHQQAKATVEAVDGIQITDDIPASIAVEDSLLSDEQKQQVSQYIQGIVATQTQNVEQTVQIREGLRLYFRPDRELESIEVGFYYSAGELPEQVSVAENRTGDDAFSSEDSEVSTFRSLSAEHYHTRSDVLEAIVYGLERTQFYPSNDIEFVDFEATSAFHIEDGDPDTVVNFYAVVPLIGG